jgi:hypothetical protein
VWGPLLAGAVTILAVFLTKWVNSEEGQPLSAWAAAANGHCVTALDELDELDTRRQQLPEEERAELVRAAPNRVNRRNRQLAALELPASRNDDVQRLVVLARESLDHEGRSWAMYHDFATSAAEPSADELRRAEALHEAAISHGKRATALARDLGGGECNFAYRGARSD